MNKKYGNIAIRTMITLVAALCYFAIAETGVRADEQKTAAKPKTHNVTFSDKGFSPRKLKIKSGDSVRWTNKSDMELQLAEGTHPKHTDCKYCPQGKKRGAYVSIDAGKSFTFKFIGAGTARMHDHLLPDMKMTIIVTE